MGGSGDAHLQTAILLPSQHPLSVPIIVEKLDIMRLEILLVRLLPLSCRLDLDRWLLLEQPACMIGQTGLNRGR